MTSQEIKETITEQNPEALFADGFDEALIGYAERCASPAVAVYGEELCIELIIDANVGMERTEAQEYFDFNVKGAYVGEHTPFFFTRLRVDKKTR